MMTMKIRTTIESDDDDYSNMRKGEGEEYIYIRKITTTTSHRAFEETFATLDDNSNMKDDEGEGDNIQKKKIENDQNIQNMETKSHRAFEKPFAALTGKSPVVFPR